MSKDTMNRIKKKSMKWKKIFANHISDKELIFRIDKAPTIQQQLN